MDKLIKNGHQNELFPSNLIISVIIYHVCTKLYIVRPFFLYIWLTKIYIRPVAHKKKIYTRAINFDCCLILLCALMYRI